MLEELNLENAKKAWSEAPEVTKIIELAETEIHSAVSLTKAVSVLLSISKLEKIVRRNTWDIRLAEVAEILKQRGFIVELISGADEITWRMSKPFSLNYGNINTLKISGWADALEEHNKLKP